MKCAHKRTSYTFTPQNKWNEENKRSSNKMLSRNELFMGIKITECACSDVASRWFSLNVEEKTTVKWEFVLMLYNYSKYRNKCNKDVCYFAVSGVPWIVCPVQIEHLGTTRVIRMNRHFISFIWMRSLYHSNWSIQFSKRSLFRNLFELFGQPHP